jgi:2-dehydro-3-deoxy-L-rhamnonate dehydrogenase (NAD+)
MNQIDLDGRIAVVTGGAMGIGYAIAERLLRSGARVVLWDGDEAGLAEACSTLAPLGPVRGHVVELTDDAAVESATAQTLAADGRIDILVNNAGISGGEAAIWQLDPAVWRRVIEVNLVAPFLACRHVVPAMLKAGFGRIVNIACVAAEDAEHHASHYSASKAGLIALTRSLAHETARRGVLVNAVTPALAHTALRESVSKAELREQLGRIPMGRFVEVEEVAAMVAWLASEDCSFSTGAVFDISGGAGGPPGG